MDNNANAILVRNIELYDELIKYRKLWNDTLLKSASENIFLTFEWMISWWHVYGQNKSLHVLIAEKDGRVIGIAPFYKEKRKSFILPISEIRILADRFVGSDFLDMIIEKGFETETVEAFYGFLIEHSVWDRLVLDNISQRSASIEHLLQFIKRGKVSFCLFQRYSCPLMVLPDTFSEFMSLPDRQYKAMVLENDMKKTENHSVVLKSASTEDELQSFLRRMFEIHTERWNNLGKRGSFADPQKRLFYTHVSKELLKSGQLDLAALEIDGNIEVMRYGMVLGKSYFSLQGGISRKGLELRAGNVLNLKIFEILCGKLKFFHFLRGSEPYKYLWGCHDAYTSLLYAGKTLPGHIALFFSKISNHVAAFIRTGADLKKRAVEICKKYSNARSRLFIRVEKWARKTSSGADFAVVLGVNTAALAFARSLGRKKIKTLLLTSQKDIAAYTRFARVVMLPPVEESASLWLECLSHIGGQLKSKGAIFAVSDEHLLFLSRYSKKIGDWFKFDVPDLTVLERIINKRLQYKIADSAGLKIPKTFYPTSEKELLKVSATLKYPCILKPYKSHIGRHLIAGKVVQVHSKEELCAQYKATKNPNVHFMVQEIIPGEDSDVYGYQAYWNHEGEEIAWMTYRKLRQYPNYFGDGTFQETVDVQAVREWSYLLLKFLRYQGICNIEYKKDARDGSYCFISFNASASLAIEQAVASGCDLPWISYSALMDGYPRVEEHVNAEGVFFMNELLDFQALSKESRRFSVLKLWLANFKHAKAKAVCRWSDPAPFLIVLWRILLICLKRSRS